MGERQDNSHLPRFQKMELTKEHTYTKLDATFDKTVKNGPPQISTAKHTTLLQGNSTGKATAAVLCSSVPVHACPLPAAFPARPSG